MSSMATLLCFSSSSTTTPPSISTSPLFRSFFQSPKKPISLNLGFRQKKPNNKVPMIFSSFHGNYYEDEFYENFPSLFGENEDQKRQKITSIKNIKPLWQILPPLSPPENPFTGDVLSLPTNLQMETLNGSGIPISLRIIKMKSRLTKNWPEILPVSVYSSVVKSISSVLLMIDELLSLICNGELMMENSITVSREMNDSLVLLFKKICVVSPNLFLLVLNLLADIIVFSSGNAARNSNSNHLNENERCFDQRRSYYERRIGDDPNNSLILGNYAQFLYQNTNDKDRAEEFFVRAVRAEPHDAETLSQYAMFLWHQKRDVDAAEEKLLAAIDADPQSCYHKSNYAWFLWQTGAADTCFPLNPLA